MKSCEYWMIAYRKREYGKDLIPENDRGVIEGFRLLPQEKYITQADPFLFTYEEETWLFYERQDLTDMKGTLWCLNLDDAGAKPVPVLEEPFHLSYPQVFRYGKEIYMLPETRNAGDIRLYRCLEFPGKWEPAESLLELEAVDTTILWDGGEDGHACYLFTYTKKRLEIYHCRLEEDRFHIVEKEKIFSSEPSDVVRPGGSMVTENGKTFRPAQNCTDYYGQELIVNEIDSLDGQGLMVNETGSLDGQGFREHEHCRLSPGRLKLAGVNPTGIHTYNRNERYEVIDILHKEIGFGTILKKIEWKLKGSGT